MAAFLSLSHSSALFLMFRLWICLIMLFLWMRCKMTLLRRTLWCRARSDPGSKSMPDHLLKPDFLIAPGQRAFIFFQLVSGARATVYCQVFNCYSKNPYVDNRLLGLGHVWDDAICDDEEHKVLGAILHWSRIPTHKNTQNHLCSYFCFCRPLSFITMIHYTSIVLGSFKLFTSFSN